MPSDSSSQTGTGEDSTQRAMRELGLRPTLENYLNLAYFGGELIDVGRLGIRTSVTGHPEYTVVLADNPEDVGFLGS